MKKTLIITAIVAILIIAGAVYFLSGQFNKANRSLFDAIPADAAFIIEFPHIKKDKQEIISSGIWEELQAYEFINRLHQELSFFDTFLINGIDEGSDLPFLATVHKIKSDDHGMLYILPAAFLDENLLQREKNTLITNSSERTYKSTKIYELTTSIYTRNIAVAVKDGLLLLSFEPFLLENAIVTLGNNIKKGNEFTTVYDLSRKSEDVKVFINLEQIATFLSIYTNPEAQPYITRISDFADWIALDLSVAGKTIILNGYASAKEDKVLSTIGGNGTEVQIKNILPFNTALFYYYNTNKLSELALQNNENNQVFNSYFKDWIGSVATFAVTEPFDTAIQNDVLVFLQSNDNELALSQLKELASRNLDVVNVEPEAYKNHEIYQISGIGAIDKFAGFKSNNITDPYFTIIEDQVVFANNLGNIKVLLERYLEQQTLSKDIDFLNFRKNMADHPRVNLYVNTSRILHILKKVASAGFSNYLDTGFNDLKKLNPLGIQFTHYKDNTFLVNGLIQSTKNFQKRTNLLWKTELLATVSMRPHIVTDHTSNEQEIFVQDDENNLYLIGKNGEILWSRQLDSKIMGSVYQVDFYTNGKLQYLFSTRESINLIDRTGEYVENFPLRMPSPITSGLAMFDYDRNNKYRMFIGCENGSIYGFEKSGKPLQGWNPRRNVGVISNPIQYLDFEGKDYLIALNDNGKLFLFNRRGDLRVPEIPLDAQFYQNFQIAGGRGSAIDLYNVSNDGRLFTVQLDGNYQTDSLSEFYEPVIFSMYDVAGDAAKEFIIMDDLNLMVFDINKKKLFEYSLPSNIDKEIFFIEDRVNKDKIGLYSSTEGLIYMITESGSLAEDFPLRGNSPFVVTDLYKDGEKIVITGTKDKTITTYRLK